VPLLQEGLIGPDTPLDPFIKQMRKKTQENPEELPRILADNIKNLDERLFLRMAEMVEETDDESEKEEINQFAVLVQKTLENILEAADTRVNEDSQIAQALLEKLADENGEYFLPIDDKQLSACRTAVVNDLARLDEGFVGIMQAYMAKLDGEPDPGKKLLVDVLRVLLQIFAAERLRSLSKQGTYSSDVDAALQAVFDAKPDEWEATIRAQECTAMELSEVLQEKVGELVLNLPGGSGVQRVLAEYLNELMTKARAVAATEED
jgi:hypothetical protein